MLFSIFLVIVTIFPSSILAKDSRIVGGEIEANHIPYQVALLVDNELACGGSILTRNCILTAAHCVKGMRLNSFTVRAGISQLNSSAGVMRKVSEAFIPSKYNVFVMNYDVAILQLRQPLSGANIATIPMNTDPLIVGDQLKVSGWGVKSANAKSTSNELRYAFVAAISRQKCNSQYSGKLTNSMFCAQVSGGGIDACYGDSGGPLVMNNKQYGIVSWGNGCARANYAGVYTSIRQVLPWINSIKAKNCL